jgi:hypothetical protein
MANRTNGPCSSLSFRPRRVGVGQRVRWCGIGSCAGGAAAAPKRQSLVLVCVAKRKHARSSDWIGLPIVSIVCDFALEVRTLHDQQIHPLPLLAHYHHPTATTVPATLRLPRCPSCSCVPFSCSFPSPPMALFLSTQPLPCLINLSS